MERANLPPIGIMPYYIWKEKRFHEVKEAIERYVTQGFLVPLEWIAEYNAFIKEDKSKWLS